MRHVVCVHVLLLNYNVIHDGMRNTTMLWDDTYKIDNDDDNSTRVWEYVIIIIWITTIANNMSIMRLFENSFQIYKHNVRHSILRWLIGFSFKKHKGHILHLSQWYISENGLWEYKWHISQ